jgi:small subunit ribosomal protein S8
MTLMDPIGDMLTRIRNGQQRLMPKVQMPSSTLRLNILEVLKNEGFISSYHIEKKENNKINLIVDLKYYEGNPVIKDIRRVSKPGRRVYSRATSIPRIQNGLGLAIISTNKGVMSDIDARKNNIGGEILCRIF